MVYTVNRSVASVLQKISSKQRIGELKPEFSNGWNETNDRVRGYFETEWGIPKSWEEVILQGPHMYVSTPLYKSPNPSMLHQTDWSATDFETLRIEGLPATSYKRACAQESYDANFSSWQVAGSDGVAHMVRARDYYRVAWRAMAAVQNERTLIPALFPPGSSHVFTVYALGLPNLPLVQLVQVAACLSSLISDMNVRATPKNHIIYSTIDRLPYVTDSAIQQLLVLRALRLNCVTDAYTDLWGECFTKAMQSDSWAGGFDHNRRKPLAAIGPEWERDTLLRIAADRRQALVEIDALVALGLGLTADELCTVYRTQFPVLYGYDRNTYLYDANGRMVPQEVLKVWRTKGDNLSVEERTSTNQAGNTYTYEPPFRFLDREADMREAYAEFEKRFQSPRSG